MKQKFFVTGGAGFIGSHLVDRLIGLGEVTVFDRVIPNTPVKDRFIKGDLLDKNALSRAMKGHDVVFHLAANPDIAKGAREPALDLNEETIATFNVLEAMRQAKITKIVFTSTSAVLGNPTIFPTPESYGPTIPTSLYGANKLACEALICAYTHTFGFQSWIFRLANIVGSRATHGVILDFVLQLRKHPRRLVLLSNGTPQKNYMHVSDCVDAMAYVFTHAKDQYNLFHLATSGQTTVAKIAQIVIHTMGLKDVTIQKGKTKYGWAGDVTVMELDTTRLRSLGWKPRYSSTDAVRLAAKELCQT